MVPNLRYPMVMSLIAVCQDAHKVTESERNFLRKRLSKLEQACDDKAKDLDRLSVCLVFN